ncbi:pilus assembly protein PilM [Candidatus Azambacteria bacterium]|nr:pilus assembly protein PilM [Candidatus Azambacteria bacterium]MBI3685705.1 pilus assembly protein PilM [Candidatus Azambacteria bacterium]
MDLAQLFRPVEKIVGVEITQGYMLAVLCERDKKGGIRVSKKSAALPPDSISQGMVKNKAGLTAAIKNFVQQNKDVFKSKYIILALPSAFVFTDIMKFPPMRPEQIGESLMLNFGSKTLFPVSPEDIYYDWQPAVSHSPLYQNALVTFALKKNINEYTEVCEQAGLEPLAFEIPQISVARALGNFKDKAGLIIRMLDEGIEFSAAAQGEFQFSRFVAMPAALHTIEEFKTFVKDEAFKVLNFFQVEYPETALSAIVVLSYFAQKEEISSYLSKELGLSLEHPRLVHSVELTDSHVAAFGSAMRGLIPREEDALVSLMPVGTEEAYRARRFRAYASLWSDIINATAFLLVVLFGVTLFFLMRVQKNLNVQIANKGSAQAAWAPVAELEQTAGKFNATVGQLTAIEAKMPRWSAVFDRMLPSLTYKNIAVASIGTRRAEGTIVVQFSAATRDEAIAFKKALETSGAYEKVEMPFLSVTQREQISTNVVLTLKKEL